MLENALFESGGRARPRKPATLLASAAIHAALIAVLVMIPILQPQALPKLATLVGIPLPETSRPAPPTSADAPRPDLQPHLTPLPTDFIAPYTIPADIAIVADTADPRLIQSYGTTARDLTSVFRAAAATPEAPSPPDPEPPAVVAPPPPRPTRVSSGAQAANLIHRVKPVYPELARRVRVQGVVVLEATISKEGTVEDIRVVSGHPLLVDAAVHAVQEWLYRPTLLNNEPVAVITTITVTFALQ